MLIYRAITKAGTSLVRYIKPAGGGLWRKAAITARYNALAVFLAVFTSGLLGQQPAGNPQHAAAPRTPLTKDTIKANVRQVLLDVVVTDQKNRSVNGLQVDDFTVYEDNAPQKIISFAVHSASPDPAYLNALTAPRLHPNTFFNTPLGNDNLPLNVLMYDLLNTPLGDQSFAHDQIIRFLRHRPLGSRLAIFVLSDRLHMLQGFADEEGTAGRHAPKGSRALQYCRKPICRQFPVPRATCAGR